MGKLIPKDIPLSGRLITAHDPSTIGENFSKLQNLRPTDTTIQGVGGMTKINTTALSSFLKIRNGFHFKKDDPAESHVLVQAYNTGETSAKVLQNETAIPDQGDFSATALQTDVSGAGRGRFSDAPNGSVAYCNGAESRIWGGDESRLSAFVSESTATTLRKNFTEELSNPDTGLTATLLRDVGTPRTRFYVGSPRMLSGVKLYVSSANSVVGSLDVEITDSAGFTSETSIVDGTAVGGAPLAQTGTITWTSGNAEKTFINGLFLYWYRFTISVAVTATTKLYYATTVMPWQPIRDIWDGKLRTTLSFQKFDGTSKYVDLTENVFKDLLDSGNTYTYADIGGLTTAEFLLCGFAERMTGIELHIDGDNPNTTAATALKVEYWNGVAWIDVTTLGALVDGTKSDISMTRSGKITWLPPGFSVRDQKKSLTDDAAGIGWYYYRLSWDQNLSANVLLYYVAGITSGINDGDPNSFNALHGYVFPLYAHNRLWLCGKIGEENKALSSARFTPDVYNGVDSLELTVGDEKDLVAGAELFGQFGSNLHQLVLFAKVKELWILAGTNPADWVLYPLSKTIGCVAPLTMKTMVVRSEDGSDIVVAIWQGANGLYMSDGRAVNSIHLDIEDIFDERNSSGINQAKIADSVGEVDSDKMEYRWNFASGSSTTLDKEFVFDLRRRKFFEIVRGTGKALQASFAVEDTNGNEYIYGAIDTGYMERLDNGTDFDGSDIVQTFRLGGIALAGTIMYESKVRRMKLLTKAKTSTTNNITVTHYSDSKTTGSSITMSPTKPGYRLAENKKSVTLAGAMHEFEFSQTTNNETIGFEPTMIGILYEFNREEH